MIEATFHEYLLLYLLVTTPYFLQYRIPTLIDLSRLSLKNIFKFSVNIVSEATFKLYDGLPSLSLTRIFMFKISTIFDWINFMKKCDKQMSLILFIFIVLIMAVLLNELQEKSVFNKRNCLFVFVISSETEGTL